MEKTIAVSGLECDSCARAVTRIASGAGVSLKSVDVSGGKVVAEIGSPEQEAALKAALEEAGYGVGAAGRRGDFSRPLALLGRVFSDGAEFAGERTIVQSGLVSLVLMLALAFVLSYTPGFPVQVPASFAPLLILSAFGIAGVYVALAHFRAFSEPFSCMTGMMIGMTIGMMGGFLAGALSGAANGMLVGSLAGMAIGMAVGVVAGKRNGVMGVLEGMMAGLMSGTMGAMLSVMLFNDNVVLFLAVLFAACMAILAGLSYMMLREGGNVDAGRVPGAVPAVALNMVAFLLLSALLVWGPRSAFAWAGGA